MHGDIFSMDDVPIDIRPTRHGITRGTTIHFFDPLGQPQRGVRWPGATGSTGDFPTINLDGGPARQGIFYHARELNERFTTVFT